MGGNLHPLNHGCRAEMIEKDPGPNPSQLGVGKVAANFDFGSR
jgi:hypothetical protein